MPAPPVPRIAPTTLRELDDGVARGDVARATLADGDPLGLEEAAGEGEAVTARTPGATAEPGLVTAGLTGGGALMTGGGGLPAPPKEVGPQPKQIGRAHV